MNNPKVSFICPNYNDGNTIGRFVESIKDQDYKNWEIIIVDDGSTDNSKEIIDSLCDGEKISAIYLKENQGACAARNIGAKKATGDYYSFLPADSFLYPGMLKIWVEQLEEYKDYDFLYGGYRLTDEEYNWLDGGELLFQPFDPYLLETTNYIDGSFPIRAKTFWEVGELMNKLGKQKSDGLWDPAIKSLNDWDFWLSVVKEGKRKGIYIQDVFFETVRPHAGGLSFDSANNWLERMDYIKKKHDIDIRRACVASIGASWHAKRLAYILNADFQEMPSRRPHHYDSLYLIGFYPEFAPQQDAMFFNNYYKQEEGRTAAKKIIHFVGTDLWQLYNVSARGLEIWREYLRNNVDEVLVEADFTQAELEKLVGIKAKIVPLPPAKLYDVMPLPEKFVVAVYMPGRNAQFYQPQLMEEVAKSNPDIDFKFFGNPMQMGKHKDIKNIEYVGYINDMEKFIKECSAIMRFPIHDGLSISVLEFVLAGRHAITNVPIKDTYLVPKSDLNSINQALKLIQESIKEKGVNQSGSDYWRKELDHDKYRKTMGELMGYNPKEYWEKRATMWDWQANAYPVEKEDIKEFFNEIKPKTILDIGCGNGRWISILKEWGFDLKGYMGTDISGKLIEIAQKRFPDLMPSQFFMEKAENLPIPKKKYDLIFSYTVMEHVKEEDIKNLAKRLKKIGKFLLLVEPINFESRYYCRNHDYKKLFKVIKEKQLADKVIYLCDLAF